MFKEYILNEEQSLLSHKINSVLTAIQELEQDLDGMGLRHIAKLAEDIVNQFRKILHGTWTESQQKFLIEIQKIAVALMKAVEDKDNLKEIIPIISQELETLTGKMGKKVNNLKAPEEGTA